MLSILPQLDVKENKTLLLDEVMSEKEVLLERYARFFKANLARFTDYTDPNYNAIEVINDEGLKQLTADHLVWFKYNDAKSILKDDIRFMIGNSYISHSIGSNKDDYRPDIVTVDNDDYEALLLFTDGITDVVSDAKIKFIYDHNISPVALLKIIDEAINSEPELISKDAKERFKNRDYMINSHTKPGKDNATMLLYKKY